MSKKTKLDIFINHIYPRRLFIVKNPTEKYLNENFKDTCSDESLTLGELNVACVYNHVVEYQDGMYGILICIQDKMEVKHIAHEATHAALEIFRDIGSYADVDNQEPFAYLVGWCADCINQVVTNKFKD